MPKNGNCNICLFDMDGTLFDYDAAIRRDLKRIASPDEKINYDDPKLNVHLLSDIPHIEERINMIRNIPGWWRRLDRFQLGWDLHAMAKKQGYEIHILTKGPSSRPHAWMEKVECLRDHFHDPKDIKIHITEEKAGRYGRVLVDDFTDYAEAWLEWRPRGLVILPISNQNKGFSHLNAIVYNGSKESGWDCMKALEAAYVRENKQHWRETKVWQEWEEERKQYQ